MKELAKHIEVLLLENDCVIVPGLGGFIAHYRPAVRKEGGRFMPPVRTIGFNSRLVMNDGLLVQSYMQAYNTDFPDATRKIEKVVEKLKEDIYQNGEVCFDNIGTLYYNISGNYEFSPLSESFFTPSLYGLEEVTLQPVAEETAVAAAEDTKRKEAATEVAMPAAVAEEEEKSVPAIVMPHRSVRWWQGAAAAAAAVLLFFVFSVTAENTYVNEDTSYASLGSASLFGVIKGQSMASQVKTDQDNKTNKSSNTAEKNNSNTLKPTTVKTETVEQEPQDDKQTAGKSDDKNGQSVSQQGQSSQKQSLTSAESSSGKSQSSSSSSSSKSGSSSSSSSSSSTVGKLFYIIVSSLTSSSDAQKEVDKLEKQGYTGAQVIESDGRYRVAIASYSSQSEAYSEVQQLKDDGKFEQAWVLKQDK